MTTTEQTAQDEWGPWVYWRGGECPIPDAKAKEFCLIFVDGSESSPASVDAKQFGWSRSLNLHAAIITHYRLRKPATPSPAYRALMESALHSLATIKVWTGKEHATSHPMNRIGAIDEIATRALATIKQKLAEVK